MVREIGGRLVVEIDHLAEVDRGLGDLLVLAELPVGDVQVGKIDAAERLDLAGERLRVLHAVAISSSRLMSSMSKALRIWVQPACNSRATCCWSRVRSNSVTASGAVVT